MRIMCTIYNTRIPIIKQLCRYNYVQIKNSRLPKITFRFSVQCGTYTIYIFYTEYPPFRWFNNTALVILISPLYHSPASKQTAGTIILLYNSCRVHVDFILRALYDRYDRIVNYILYIFILSDYWKQSNHSQRRKTSPKSNT